LGLRVSPLGEQLDQETDHGEGVSAAQDHGSHHYILESQWFNGLSLSRKEVQEASLYGQLVDIIHQLILQAGLKEALHMIIVVFFQDPVLLDNLNGPGVTHGIG